MILYIYLFIYACGHIGREIALQINSSLNGTVILAITNTKWVEEAKRRRPRKFVREW
jgi:hypothetical protein